MSQTFRHPDILEIARSSGKVTVDDLARRFGVTVQTIRRDLAELTQSGKLERVHGGAILPSGVANIVYEERRRLNDAAKRRIAERCAEDIPNDAAVFLNIGTTTEAVARALLNHRNLLVVTNNMNVATILSANTHCDITLTGGTLRRADGGLTGPGAVAGLERFRFDFAVLGCSAIDRQGDLLDFDPMEVLVSGAALKRSKTRFLVADQSKTARSAPLYISGLDEFDSWYTDAEPSPDLTGLSDIQDRLVVAT